MTKCYPVKSKFVNLHGDCTVRVAGISVKVSIEFDDWNDLIPKRDLVCCSFEKGNYYVTRVFKNKVKI